MAPPRRVGSQPYSDTAYRLLDEPVTQPKAAVSSTPHNYAPEIERLQTILREFDALADEKSLVDRPLKPQFQNGSESDIYKAVSVITALFKEQQFDKKEAKLAIVNSILDRYFDSTEHEVKIFKLKEQHFLPEVNSFLYIALTKLKIYSELPDNAKDADYFTLIINMANDALDSYKYLYRTLTVSENMNILPNDPVYNIVEKLYSDVELAQLITFAVPLLDKNNKNDLFQFFTNNNLEPHRSLKRSESSIIPMPKPVLVPGGRFVEGYYWDTYWIIRGLCVSGKLDDAINMLINFFSCIDRFGFVPNGFRQYYLDRSQPPILIQSVHIVYNSLKTTGNHDKAAWLLKQAFPRLLIEYFGFWMNPNKGHLIRLTNKGIYNENNNETDFNFYYTNTDDIYLNRYYSTEDSPRPESYTADINALDCLDKHIENIDEKKRHLFRSIRAAAESGWDFSSRWSRHWFRGTGTDDPKLNHQNYFSQIDTLNIAPIDLNALMYSFETTLTLFSKELIPIMKAIESVQTQSITVSLETFVKFFKSASNHREKAIQQLMFHKETNTWRDIDIVTGQCSNVISAASYFPLWANIQPPKGLKASFPMSLIRQYGIIPTAYQTGQQWDAPNVWPPLVQIAVSYLSRKELNWDLIKLPNSPLNQQECFSCLSQSSIAQLIASNFLWTTSTSYSVLKIGKNGGYFYEKYNADHHGRQGSGGEYQNQVGFGWTNGVILDFISQFNSAILPKSLLLQKEKEKERKGVKEYQDLVA